MLKETSLQMLIAYVNSMSQQFGTRPITQEESDIYTEACKTLAQELKLIRLKGEADVKRRNSEITNGP
jgi:hypothetical protein